MTSPAVTEVQQIREARAAGDVPLWTHPEWLQRFPWLLQGTTGRGDEEEPFDLGLFRGQNVRVVHDRWRELLVFSGGQTAVHARQAHGIDLLVHERPYPRGLFVGERVDAHVTRVPGLVVTVAAADCVPVFIVDPVHRAVAVAHSGWRGTAAGMTERVVETMVMRMGSDPAALHLHAGPAICGECYEVSPDVHRAVSPEEPIPAGPAPVDLRAAIQRRAVAAGVPAEQVTASSCCTRCGPPDFFSHRAGSTGRQVGLVMIREAA